ncbi:alpha/beta fold hydrolase [Pelomonas sp. V22]|uniref:alpha/beta hydrolase n=1 Tax=Pelomonas sp. V22 TaxID=2822139 RepID=UPI0024A9FDC6|nr:alpha/beta fold hydrolase [Pelomonas sp. V22]MDI4635368.1 alpha/beta fold hydrolase [Pelomonas sp. V22]
MATILALARRLLMLAGLLSLAACQTVNLPDREFIKPDRVTGFQAKAPLDEQQLASLLPQARVTPLQLKTEGTELNGVLLERPDAVATVLFYGGNLFHLDDAGAPVVKALAACPVNIAMFDYRGYGRSPGQPTPELMAADALRIYDHVRQLQQPGGKLVVHGYSLGSFMAGQVASQRPLDGLVLAAAAPSPRAMAEYAVGQRAGLLAPLIRLQLSEGMARIDNRQALGRYQGPLLMLAGSRDQTSPAELGRQLFEAVPSARKDFLLLPEATHDTMLPRKEAMERYCEFVRSVASSR